MALGTERGKLIITHPWCSSLLAREVNPKRIMISPSHSRAYLLIRQGIIQLIRWQMPGRRIKEAKFGDYVRESTYLANCYEATLMT